jgi:NADH dehydrogenase
MAQPTLLILGGTGFIGRSIVARLSAAGWRVRVPTRRLARARALMPLPTVEVLECNINADGIIEHLTAGTEAVINLVGVLHGRRAEPWGAEFESAHVAIPRAVIAACRAHAVTRLLHMSALGVGSAQPLPSMYLRSKAEGERLVRDSGLAWTVFRPSVVFGAEDRFVNLFGQLQRFSPFVPLAGANTRFQPIWVGDVAQAFVNALSRPETVGKVYELGGPQVLRLREIVGLAGRLKGCRRPVIDLPDALGRLQAMLLSALPGPTLMSPDNLDSMKIDNVAEGPIAAELGITPMSIEAGMTDPEAIRQRRRDSERAHARRSAQAER